MGHQEPFLPRRKNSSVQAFRPQTASQLRCRGDSSEWRGLRTRGGGRPGGALSEDEAAAPERPLPQRDLRGTFQVVGCVFLGTSSLNGRGSRKWREGRPQKLQHPAPSVF